jgi:hypothetical protein
MGYSEVVCRICGVSFNIGRIRKADEPPSHGWTKTGDESWIEVNFVQDLKEMNNQCDRIFDCESVERAVLVPEHRMTEYRRREKDRLMKIEEDEVDEDFVPSPEDEQYVESYEYESDEEMWDE